MAEEYKEVKSVMEQIVSGVVDSKYAYGIRSGSGLAVKLDGINTFVQTRFNLYTEIRNDNSNEQNETLLKQNLSEAGFTAIGILPHSGSAGPIINGYKNSDNIVCGFYSDTNWVSENYSYDFTSLSCGKPNWAWLTGEEQTLIQVFHSTSFPWAVYGSSILL